MENTLYNQIIAIQNGAVHHIKNLIPIFENIINKYSRQLNGEDTKQDLYVFLIQLIYKLPIHSTSFCNDKQILAYISKSLKFEYIRLSKLHSKISSNEYFLSDILDFPAKHTTYNIEIIDLFKNLNDIEKNILSLIFIKGFTVSEIAKSTHKSRQAINQSKIRALGKLKNYAVY